MYGVIRKSCHYLLCKVPPNTASAVASNCSLAFLSRFLQCETSFTNPHNLRQLWFQITDDVCVFFGVCKILSPDIAAEQHMVTYRWMVCFGDNTSCTPVDSVWTNFVLSRPFLQWNICHLPDSGRHMTGPNQGHSSLAPGGGKMRDPGNEVENLLMVLSTARALKKFQSKAGNKTL